MATEETTISDLELTEDILPDMLFPVENASETKATTFSAIKNWLNSFFVSKTGDQAIDGNKTIIKRTIFNNEIILADTKGTAPDNPPSQLTSYGTIRWIVKATEGVTGGYGGGQELFKIQPILNSLGQLYVPVSYVYKNGREIFSFGCNADGSNPYFKTVTPATTDNSTNAATTAFVNNFITNLSSTVGSGYVYIGKLLIQWGSVNVNSGDNPEYVVTFHKPFASSSSYTIVKNYGSSFNSTSYDREVSFYNQTTTQATTYSLEDDSSIFYWIAIGQGA